ncbi:hypothetical protein [Methylobacterium sp. CM6244]
MAKRIVARGATATGVIEPGVEIVRAEAIAAPCAGLMADWVLRSVQNFARAYFVAGSPVLPLVLSL